MIMTAVKNAGKKLFSAFGLEIRRKRAEEIPRAGMRGALRQLCQLGFRPRTVIDVGVAWGTHPQLSGVPALPNGCQRFYNSLYERPTCPT